MYKDDDVIKTLTKNSIRCLVCSKVLESKYQHNFVSCGCHNQAFTDGGLVYQRIGAKDLDMVESLSEYEEITYSEVKARGMERKRIEEEKLQQRINNGEMIVVNGVWISKIVWDKVKYLDRYKGLKGGSEMKPLLSCEVDIDKVIFPIYVSVKFDGIRALVKGGVVYSRSLKPIKNEYVQRLFGKKEYGGFDGELVVGDIYAKDVFQKTTSGVMSKDGEPDVRFYVFDLWNLPNEDYESRQRVLQDLLLQDSTMSSVVYTMIHKCHAVEDLDFFLKHEEKVGGEGLIGRNPKGRYKYGRSTQKEQFSMKFKFFVDSEFEVIGFEELYKNTNEQVINELGYAKRSTHKKNQIPMNTLGSLVLKFGDTTFNVGSGFTGAQRAEIWANRDNYIGKLAVVRYMDVGVKLVPRLPSFKGWRDIDDIGG